MIKYLLCSLRTFKPIPLFLPLQINELKCFEEDLSKEYVFTEMLKIILDSQTTDYYGYDININMKFNRHPERMFKMWISVKKYFLTVCNIIFKMFKFQTHRCYSLKKVTFYEKSGLTMLIRYNLCKCRYCEPQLRSTVFIENCCGVVIYIREVWHCQDLYNFYSFLHTM